MAKLDDLSWHLEDAGLPEETAEVRGATHMGFFLHWAVRSGFWQGLPKDAGDVEIELLRRGELTGTTFLLQHCDGKLLSEVFTAEGARVAEKYYSRYVKLYGQVTSRSGFRDYHVPDTLEVFERVCQAIDADRAAQASKPWWRRW